MRSRSWWGWGWAEEMVDGPELAQLAARAAPLVPLAGEVIAPPPVPALPPPRIRPPDFANARSDDLARAAHTHGKAYRDVMRNLRGELVNPPAFVWYPASVEEVGQALEWAAEHGVPLVPYGGGSSVVGGVEHRGDSPHVSLDLSKLDAVLEVDSHSLLVQVQGGIFGPALEDRLRPWGLTLRHYPQSFEFSTVGGWLATRAGGHFATGYTHIDDLVSGLSVVTPVGPVTVPALPASGAGPSQNGIWLGSEGAFGVITSAWLRVHRRPVFKERAVVSFDSFEAAVGATREVVQSGLRPANCRLLDPLESLIGAGAPESRLILGFESAHHPVAEPLSQAVEICLAHGGAVSDAGAWRDTFLKAPYLRDGLARLGVIVETFETACTWTRFEALHAAVAEAVRPAVVTCRFTHVYPDGPAPYFTVYAPGVAGGEIDMWDGIKAAASAAIIASGGTITHHHAVGRDHVPWYDPGPALRAVKQALDPQAILNPGVLGLSTRVGA